MPKSFLLAVAFPILVFALFVVAGAVEELESSLIVYWFSGRSANPWVSGVVYLYLGAAIGLEAADLLPHRFFPVKSPFPGVSLVLAPLCAGLLMQFFGSWPTAKPARAVGLRHSGAERSLRFLPPSCGGSRLAAGSDLTAPTAALRPPPPLPRRV